MQDLRFALRQLLRNPGFTAVAVLTLALGIGANTAIFSIVRAVLLEPLPYRDSGRLLFVWLDRSDAKISRAPLSSPDLRDLREGSRTCEAFGGIWASSTVSLRDGDAAPEQLRAAWVTPNFFDVLGAECALGRTFRPEDSEPGAPPTVLLAWDLFERRFGGDPAVVGQQILVNNQATRIIGVMPKPFRLLLPPDAAVPDHLQVWQAMPRDFDEWPRGALYLRVVGRMRPGFTLAQAQADLASIGQHIAEETGSRRAFAAVSLKADGVRELRGPLLSLFAGVTILLGIACVNVASLLTARALARVRETSVRLALGATRRRLAMQCLVEGGLLTVLGLAAAWWVGWAGLHLLQACLPESLSRIRAAKMDVPVLTFTAGISAVWGLMFSLAPLVELRRVTAAASLHRSPITSLGPLGRYAAPGRHRLRNGLVVSQIALSLLLLIGAGLLMRTFINLQRVDLGYQADRHLTFRVALPEDRYPSADAVTLAVEELQHRLAAIPGVRSAGAISHLPFDDLPNWGLTYREDSTAPNDGSPFANARAITPGLLETLGVQLIEGRLFDDQDNRSRRPVVVVNEVMANGLWPDRSPVGQEFMLGQAEPDRRVAVVGVIRHIKQRSLVSASDAQIFLPLGFWQRSPMAFVVRGDSPANPTAMTSNIRAAVAAFDPNLPIYDMRPLNDYLEAARSSRRFTMLLAGAFAVSALALTCIGLYGVLSCAVAHRHHEFGVRSALGAVPRQLLGQIVRESLGLAAAGCCAGLALALCLMRLLQTQLYGTPPWDPVTCGAAISLVLAGTLIASWIPALRVARIRPVEALRCE